MLMQVKVPEGTLLRHSEIMVEEMSIPVILWPSEDKTEDVGRPVPQAMSRIWEPGASRECRR